MERAAEYNRVLKFIRSFLPDNVGNHDRGNSFPGEVIEVEMLHVVVEHSYS